MFHATSRRHLMLQHLSPRTTIFYSWDHITRQCRLGTTISHHHISTEAHAVPHHTDSPHLTRAAIPYPQLFHTTPTFNITAYFTPHHIPHRITPHHIPHRITPHQIPYRITPPHLTSQHITSFFTWRHTTITQHIAYHHNSTPPLTFHIVTDLPHLALWQPFHIPEHRIPHAIVHTFCISVSRTMSEIATFNIAPHFTYTDITSHQIAPPHVGTPFHITPCTHHHIRI